LSYAPAAGIELEGRIEIIALAALFPAEEAGALLHIP